jgi:hypothetical protein
LRALGLEAVISEIRRAEHIAPAIEALQGFAEALYVAGDPLVTTNRNRLGILAVGARLPTMHGNRENVDAGGLNPIDQTFRICPCDGAAFPVLQFRTHPSDAADHACLGGWGH